MIALSPTRRLEWMLSQPELKDAAQTIRKLIEGYERFLANTDASEGELVKAFLNKESKKKYWDSAFEFGDLVFRGVQRRWKREQIPPASCCVVLYGTAAVVPSAVILFKLWTWL